MAKAVTFGSEEIKSYSPEELMAVYYKAREFRDKLSKDGESLQAMIYDYHMLKIKMRYREITGTELWV